mgnify:FL=1
MIRKVFIFLILMTVNTNAQDLRKLVDLRGDWFFNLGDDINWSKENVNTKNWDAIKVPSAWEDQGYNGYDGYAWYRKSFNFHPRFKDSSLLFRLGRIDDVSQIFLNEKQIGIYGSFPPNYRTAYDQWIEIQIPRELFKIDKSNTIAIRVYDAELSGGIIDGEISIYEIVDELPLELNLEGEWKFTTSDNSQYKISDFNDTKWTSIIVPGKWESQGFAGYDGIAWYRKSFTISKKLKDKKLVIVLGKIDDIDEVYLNGKLIGSTGNFYRLQDFNKQNQWQKLRSYFIIDNSIFNFNGENVISVRVYDGFQDGGIFEGPIGIAEQSAFTKYWKKVQQRENKNSNSWFWDWLFD